MILFLNNAHWYLFRSEGKCCVIFRLESKRWMVNYSGFSSYDLEHFEWLVKSIFSPSVSIRMNRITLSPSASIFLFLFFFIFILFYISYMHFCNSEKSRKSCWSISVTLYFLCAIWTAEYHADGWYLYPNALVFDSRMNGISFHLRVPGFKEHLINYRNFWERLCFIMNILWHHPVFVFQYRLKTNMNSTLSAVLFR